jgi:hypothetical protein
MTSYLSFKNKMIEEDIMLFDSEYRVIFNNMKVLDNLTKNKNKDPNSLIQKGGYYSANLSDSPFYILEMSNMEYSVPRKFEKQLFDKKFKTIVQSLKEDNFERALYVCNKSYFPILV